MLNDQDIAEAKRALKELADEAQGNGNSEGWIAAQERPIRAVIAAHEAKAAPAVPQGEPIKDHVIREAVNQLRDCAVKFHAAQQLRERIAGIIVPLLKSTPATPSQPVNRPQNCGTSFCSCIECVCEPEPVTLTEREVGDCIDKTNRESQYGTHHFGWFLDFSANIIAALREKGSNK